VSSSAVAAGVLALLLAATAGCGEDRRQVAIFDVSPDGPTRLVLSVESCNASPRAHVDEHDDRVVVTVTADDRDDMDDCADGVVVELDEPLGDRELVDGSTGDAVTSLGG
jgi:hypothetical protein